MFILQIRYFSNIAPMLARRLATQLDSCGRTSYAHWVFNGFFFLTLKVNQVQVVVGIFSWYQQFTNEAYV